MRFSYRSVMTLVLTGFLISPLSAIGYADQPPTPEKFLGFRVGEDKKLARWEKIVEYMRVIANSSDRVRLRDLGKTTKKFDAIVLPDQQPRDILTGYDFKTVRAEYRGGIGDEGVEALRQFVRDGGTIIAMGASCDLMIDKFPIPVRNLKRGLSRDQHFAPGTIVRVQVDNTHPLGLGMPAESYGFYNNSPFFALVEGFSSQKASVVARYPNSDVVASGWLKGEDLMSGRAAVVSVEMDSGRIVLFGLRPQHRAQTHATFPMLFNAFYLTSRENMALR